MTLVTVESQDAEISPEGNITAPVGDVTKSWLLLVPLCTWSMLMWRRCLLMI